MTIQQLWDIFLISYQKEEIPVFFEEKFNHECTLRFREENGKNLSVEGAEVLLVMLNDLQKKWLVPFILNALENIPDFLMEPVLKAGIQVSNMHYNRGFILPLLRMFGVSKVNAFLNRYLSEDPIIQNKIGVITMMANSLPSNLVWEYARGGTVTVKEGFKYFWNGRFYDYGPDSRIEPDRIHEMEIEMNNLLDGRYSVLLSEYLKLNIREILSHIKPLLPTSLDNFPDGLRGEAEQFLKKIL